MIIDLEKFIGEERACWTELEEILDAMEKDPACCLSLDRIKRFHYLYQRTSSDLSRIETFSSEKDLKVYLESIVSRAFGEIHDSRRKKIRISPVHWFFNVFPQAFRRQITAFWIGLVIMASGFAFGGFAVSFDPDAKQVLMPFPHLQIDPSQRVALEENAQSDRLENRKASFSSELMTHNTRVAIFSLALGVTWGIGTIILLFSNGVMLGAVVLDYVMSKESVFLLGWLLPHGSIEIPAILIASQAGLVLASAVIGWGRPLAMRERLRKVSGDIVTLIIGVSIMLVWAGIIEAFLSQYHAPVIPYEIKISFGAVELLMLIYFLARSGRGEASSRVGKP